MGEEYYGVVDRASCQLAGLFEEQGTVDWWAKQSAEARSVLAESERGTAPHIQEALQEFNRWLLRIGGDAKNIFLWGNGADFDNALMAAAYTACKMRAGWASYNGRCYRSLKNLHPLFGLGRGPAMERGGTHHNALDDAKSQARHAIAIVADLRRRVVGWEALGDELH